jgi:hypothetical protein
MRLLQQMVTPAHLSTIRDEAFALATQRRENDEPDLTEVRAYLNGHILHPFEDFQPTNPSSLEPRELRASAAEHLVSWLAANLDDRAPIPSYEELVVTHREAIRLDLQRLRDGTWDVWEREGLWTVMGRVWGILTEISFDTETLVLDRVYVEFD